MSWVSSLPSGLTSSVTTVIQPVIKFRLNSIQIDMVFGRAADSSKLLEFQQKSPPPAVSHGDGDTACLDGGSTRKEYLIEDADLAGAVGRPCCVTLCSSWISISRSYCCFVILPIGRRRSAKSKWRTSDSAHLTDGGAEHRGLPHHSMRCERMGNRTRGVFKRFGISWRDQLCNSRSVGLQTTPRT